MAGSWPNEMGETTPDGVQHLLERAQWDTDAARDILGGYVVEQVGDPDGVMIVDETGFIKKGIHSVGVQRQLAARPGASRTVRSEYFYAMPALVAVPSSTVNCTFCASG